MPTSQSRLQLIIEAQNKASASLQQIERSMKGVSRAMEGVGTSFFSAEVAVQGLTQAIRTTVGIAKSLVTNVYETTNAFDSYRARLQTILGTQEQVNKTLSFLADFAQKTPYQLGEVTDAFVRLSAYGLAPTADRFRVIGDFAASMNRSFTDAVEAIADATHGEFERLREFGITKEMVAAQDKNLVNARGQITDYAKFQETLFRMMADRSAGAMERLMQTPAGAVSNMQDAISRAMLKLGDSLTKPFINAVTVITRAVEYLSKSGLLDKIGEYLAKLFSVENMKTFAKAVINVGFTLKETFTQTIGQAIALWGELKARALSYFNTIKGFWYWMGGDKANAMKFGAEGRRQGAQADAFKKQVEMFNNGPVIDKAGRAWATSFVDQMFKGLNDKPIKFKGSKPASFGALLQNSLANPLAAGGAQDRITEAILGGGQLARLGVKASQLGGGFKFLSSSKSLNINVEGTDQDLKRFVEKVAKATLHMAIKQNFVAVPGGH